MQNLFNEFPAVSEKEWRDQIEKDLKGNTIADALVFSNAIEGISHTAFAYKHSDLHEVPGADSLTRSSKTKDNNWEIITVLKNVSPKALNQTLLDLLMRGTTGFTIDLAEYTANDCAIAFKDVGFDYITVNFFYRTKEQYEWLSKCIQTHKDFKGSCIYLGSENLTSLEGCRTKWIDANSVQKSGGNTAQEIAFALHKGHEELFKMLENGLSIKAANAKFQFHFGVGSNYFYEITKFRVFRKLWSKILAAYQADYAEAPYISAETGLLNKSLQDPNTNLLRQTTEAMSAILGGVDELTVLPYDWKSASFKVGKSQRLATNISLILKEESYFDKVIDPIGGAYNLEILKNEVEKIAWELFLTLEKKGLDPFKKAIQHTVNKRIKNIENKHNTLIGINKYLNPDKEISDWLPAEEFKVGKELILERDCKLA